MTDEQIIKALERCFTRGFDELCEFGDTGVIGNVYDNPELLEVER